jgi:triosephosphate isomerase (TIM)
MAAPTGLIAGNWKMNLFHQDAQALANDLAERMEKWGRPPLDIAVCPPITLAGAMAAFLASTPIKVGAQDCSPLPNGPHTGDISAEMIANLGLACCIVGHSERRRDHKEDDALVAAKAQAVWRAQLTAIICVGETEAERDAGKTLEVVTRQVNHSVPDDAVSLNTVIAYEPVWAIGTGRTPTLKEIEDVHKHIRDLLFERFDFDGYAMRILYGGSVTPQNCRDILFVPNVNGALVGGASLKGETFWPIIEAGGAVAARNLREKA